MAIEGYSKSIRELTAIVLQSTSSTTFGGQDGYRRILKKHP